MPGKPWPRRAQRRPLIRHPPGEQASTFTVTDWNMDISCGDYGELQRHVLTGVWGRTRLVREDVRATVLLRVSMARFRCPAWCRRGQRPPYGEHHSRHARRSTRTHSTPALRARTLFSRRPLHMTVLTQPDLRSVLAMRGGSEEGARSRVH